MLEYLAHNILLELHQSTFSNPENWQTQALSKNHQVYLHISFQGLYYFGNKSGIYFHVPLPTIPIAVKLLAAATTWSATILLCDGREMVLTDQLTNEPQCCDRPLIISQYLE